MRLTGKRWDRCLTAGQRRAMAARDLADVEEERAALAAHGAAAAVVQAYQVVRRSGRDVSLQLSSFGVVTG